MTTNHRPTLEGKKGRNNTIQDSIKHARALPQNTRLKFRSDVRKPILSHSKGNKAVKELKEELLLSEIATNGDKRNKDIADKETSISNATLLTGVTGPKENEKHASDDENTTGNEPQPESEGSTFSLEEEDEEEEEEETDDEDELIMQELAKIKKERALKRENDSVAKEKDDVSQKNPLLNIDKNRGTGGPKASSWRKTTAFRNEKSQHNGEEYTNDTLKSEFHQKFLSKYIQ